MAPQTKTTIAFIGVSLGFAAAMTLITDKSLEKDLKRSRTMLNLPADKLKSFLTETTTGKVVRRTIAFTGFLAIGGVLLKAASFTANQSKTISNSIHQG